jgi:3-oxoacyl-[acyl-carrier protein] reductase
MGCFAADDMSTTERVVVITGASGGLGSALCDAFASGGWRVVATSRNESAPRGGVEWRQLDLTRVEEIERVFADIGRVDALVNNAGVTADAPLAQMSDEDWDRVLDVNLRAAFRCARAVARPMIRQRGGHIINVSSFGARSGPRGQANYAAAKAGLIGLTQSLAKELGSRNVRVNAIFPGVLPTRMTAHLSAERMAEFAAANALGRINSLDEVARFVVFLAGTENISGQVFQLDSRIAPWT